MAGLETLGSLLEAGVVVVWGVGVGLLFLYLLLSSHSVLSDSLQPHGLQNARFSRPSPSPKVCSNSCPLSQWFLWTISSSVVAFSSCFQPHPASGSFPMIRLFPLGSQSIGISALPSVLPMNIQGWFPLGLLVWPPCCPRDSQESSLAPQFESWNSLVLSLLYGPTLSSIHDHWKNYSFDHKDLHLHVKSNIFAF